MGLFQDAVALLQVFDEEGSRVEPGMQYHTGPETSCFYVNAGQEHANAYGIQYLYHGRNKVCADQEIAAMKQTEAKTGGQADLPQSFGIIAAL